MKKKVSVVIAGIALLSMSLGGMVTKASNNNVDTKFVFSFSSWSPYEGWLTASRPKTDKTSSYMKCKVSAGKTYNAKVLAASDLYMEFGINVGSPNYVFQAGTTRFMTNYVREKGYGYARIEATPNYSGSYEVSGLWSPDSI